MVENKIKNPQEKKDARRSADSEISEIKKAEKKTVATDKNTDKKIIELKIELLKHTQKRKNIKKEIAQLLTMKQKTKLGEKE